jgi:hypothetical protein
MQAVCQPQLPLSSVCWNVASCSSARNTDTGRLFVRACDLIASMSTELLGRMRASQHVRDILLECMQLG